MSTTSEDIQQQILAIAGKQLPKGLRCPYQELVVCPDGHPISIDRTSILWEEVGGKSFRASCSGGEFVFEF